MKYKRLIILCIVGLICFELSACGENDEETNCDVSTELLALFAKAAYNDDLYGDDHVYEGDQIYTPESGPLQILDPISLSIPCSNCDWKLVHSRQSGEWNLWETDFWYQIYESRNAFVIAFRGTPGLNIVNPAVYGNWMETIKMIFNGKHPQDNLLEEEVLNEVVSFDVSNGWLVWHKKRKTIKHFLEEAIKKNKKIFITGHSLGGHLAIVAYKHIQDQGYAGLVERVETFNPVGVSEDVSVSIEKTEREASGDVRKIIHHHTCCDIAHWGSETTTLGADKLYFPGLALDSFDIKKKDPTHKCSTEAEKTNVFDHLISGIVLENTSIFIHPDLIAQARIGIDAHGLDHFTRCCMNDPRIKDVTCGEDKPTANCPTCTDPSKIDTDGDGLSDNLESEHDCLDPRKADTDGDGYPDGVEAYANELGSISYNPPFNPCQFTSLSASNLAAMYACRQLNTETIYKVSIGDIEFTATDEFTESSKIHWADWAVGVMLYNPTKKVVGIALSTMPTGVDAMAEETAGQNLLKSIGNVSAATAHAYTTWDGFSASRASYNLAGSSDLKATANEIVGKFLPGATNLLNGTAGINGPFRIEASYVRRSSGRSIVLMAIMPTGLYDPNETFELADLASGSSLAQFGDTTSAKCALFKTDDTPKIDFVWVVDCSASMSAYQNAVGTAGNGFLAQLANANIDWRMAGMCASPSAVTTPVTSHREGFRAFTTDKATIQSWFTSNGPSPAFYSSGSGERVLQTAKALIEQRFTNASYAGNETIRPDAALVFLLLGDADDQYPSMSENSIADLNSFFDNYRGPLGSAKLQMHGILCMQGLNADGVTGSTSACGNETQRSPRRAISIINHLGGVKGDIYEVQNSGTTALTPILTNIMAAATSGTSTYMTAHSALASTLKVSLDSSVQTFGISCDKNNVPRSRNHGFDYDGTTQRLLFFGDCRPQEAGKDFAISYRHRNDVTSDPNGEGLEPACTDYDTPDTNADNGTTSPICTAVTTCSGHGSCNASGGCNCATGFTGANCSQCASGYSGYPNCTATSICTAASTCSGHGSCNASGGCNCAMGFTGANCNQCASGYSGYPNCK
jgi:hypothetical protein